MKPKSIITLSLALSLFASLSAAEAQTATAPPPPNPLLAPAVGVTPGTNTPAPTAGFLNQQFSTLFGLYDPNVDYYADTNEFSVRTGLSYQSNGQGIEQEIEPQFFHKFSAGWLGVGINVDTLGNSASSVDAFGFHGYYKYASHNLAGLFDVGYQHNQDDHSEAAEFGFGIEAYVTQHIGVFASYNLGHTFGGGSEIYGRLVTGASWKF